MLSRLPAGNKPLLSSCLKELAASFMHHCQCIRCNSELLHARLARALCKNSWADSGRLLHKTAALSAMIEPILFNRTVKTCIFGTMH